MGGLAGLSLFFGVLLSGVFLKRGNLPLAVVFALIAAAPVVFLIYQAIHNRRLSRGRPRSAGPEVRRTARLAGGAAAALGTGTSIATLWFALRLFPLVPTAAWAATVVLVVVAAALSIALLVAAVQVLHLTWQAAATIVRMMYLLGLAVGLTTAHAITDLGRQWPIALAGVAITAAAVGVIVLQKRALRALGAPGTARRARKRY